MYRILVAEDEKTERTALLMLLREKYSEHFSLIESASDGLQAFEKINELDPHILLIDIQMPGMNGIEVLKKVRGDHQDMEVVIITAYNYFEYARQSISLGVRDYLLKPVLMQDFDSVMDLMISNVKKRENLVSILSELIVPDNTDEWISKISNTGEYKEIFHRFSGLSLDGNTDQASRLMVSAVLASTAGSVHRTLGIILMVMDYFFNSLKLPENEFYKSINEKLLKRISVGEEETGSLFLLINDFLVNVNKLVEHNSSSTENNVIIKMIDDYLNKNYMNNISLNDLSVLTDRNQAYISRLYKKITGLNIIEKIKEIRIEKARIMLATGKYSIKEVAYETGFNDPNYFSVVFKKETGVLASDYLIFHRNKL